MNTIPLDAEVVASRSDKLAAIGGVVGKATVSDLLSLAMTSDVDPLTRGAPAAVTLTFNNSNQVLSQEGSLTVGSWVLNLFVGSGSANANGALILINSAQAVGWQQWAQAIRDVVNTGAVAETAFTLNGDASAAPVTATVVTVGTTTSLTLTAKVGGLSGNEITYTLVDTEDNYDTTGSLSGGAEARIIPAPLLLTDAPVSGVTPGVAGQHAIVGTDVWVCADGSVWGPATDANVLAAAPVTPQNYGAIGNGVSNTADDNFDNLAAAQVVYPRCAALTEEMDGLAIQKAFDTGRHVYIPNGRYQMSTTVDLVTRGQVISGESPTQSILQWVTDVDGFHIVESTEANTNNNYPMSSLGSNSWCRVENLLLYGVANSTKKGIKNESIGGGSTLWIGEGWRIDFCTFLQWQVGLFSQNAARYNSRSLTFKTCDIGMLITNGGTTTNNCHIFNGINCLNCDTGVQLLGVNAGMFVLQDFARCAIGVDVQSSQVDFQGGELEDYTTTFFKITSSLVTIRGARFLASTTLIPIQIDEDSSAMATPSYSSVELINSRLAQAGSTAVLAKCHAVQTKVFGTPAANMNNSAPGSLATSRIQLSSGAQVYLGPIPWLPGAGPFMALATTRGVMHWREAVSASNLDMDDIQGHIDVAGTVMRADVFKTNNFFANGAATVYNMQGYEDVIGMSNTSNRTVILRRADSSRLRASATQMRKVTILDTVGNAGTNNITVTANTTIPEGTTSPADKINGASTFVISDDYGSVTLGTYGGVGDNSWFVIK